MTASTSELNLIMERRARESIQPYKNNYIDSFAKKLGPEAQNPTVGSVNNINDSKNIVWEYNNEKNDFEKIENKSNNEQRGSIHHVSEGPRQSSIKPTSKQYIGQLTSQGNTSMKYERQLSTKNADVIAEYEDDTDEFGGADSKHFEKQPAEDTNTQFTLANKNSYDSNQMSPTKAKAAVTKRNVPLIDGLNVKKRDPFQEQIENARENSVINLPSQLIRIQNLRITSSITIKGNPGTILEITEGPIVIDLDDSGNHDRKVTFCECTIYLDMSKQRILENLNTRSDSNTRRGGHLHKDIEDSFKTFERKTHFDGNKSYHVSSSTSRSHHQDGNQFPLFLVKSNSILEVRDCQLKSLVKKNLIYTDEAKYLSEIQDICFHLESSLASISGNRPRRHATLYLKSTTMSYFSCFIQMDTFTSLYAQRCFFSESRGHSIDVANPKTLKIAESVFEKSEKSSINIRFSRDLGEDTSRNITIIENQLLNSYSYGISIFGENLKHQSITLIIMKNKIFHSKKDSIGIKFLNISDLQILDNDIKSSKGNGVYLHQVHDSLSNKQIILSENKICLSEMNGIFIKDSSCLLESNEIAQNNKHGVHIANSDTMNAEEYSFYKKNSMKLFLNNCRIFGNTDTGVYLTGILKGPMILNSCLLNENFNGLVIEEKEVQNYSFSQPNEDRLKGSQSKNKSIGSPQRFAHFLIEKSEIARNIHNGITIQRLWSDLFVSENMISGNKIYAIWIENVTDKFSLKLKDLERGRLREYVQGFVGGPWGEIYDDKGSACKGSTCNIF